MNVCFVVSGRVLQSLCVWCGHLEDLLISVYYGMAYWSLRPLFVLRWRLGGFAFVLVSYDGRLLSIAAFVDSDGLLEELPIREYYVKTNRGRRATLDDE